MNATTVLDRYFQETRCKIIEIAATLDRLDRADGDASADRRIAQIRRAIELLAREQEGRAVKCQMAFSLAHDESWKAPNAR